MNKEELKNLGNVLNFIKGEIARINVFLDDQQSLLALKQELGQGEGDSLPHHGNVSLSGELQNLSYMHRILQHLKSKLLTEIED